MRATWIDGEAASEPMIAGVSHQQIHRKTIASMQERTYSKLDVAAIVMLLDCGMSLKDIAECSKLEAIAVRA